MERSIIRDRLLLGMKCRTATPEDLSIADDLRDTLAANRSRCVGMGANMIGQTVRILVYDDNGTIGEMFNPELLSCSDPYVAMEGCLSLDDDRSGRHFQKVKRYRKIKVRWQDRGFKPKIRTFTGLTAQIIQHEMDHCNGIII